MRYRKTWRLVTDDPPAMLRIAKMRTGSLLQNMALLDFDLSRVLVSAYMQGIVDAGMAAINQGFVPRGIAAPFVDAGEGI